jgi:hypothetical protein
MLPDLGSSGRIRGASGGGCTSPHDVGATGWGHEDDWDGEDSSRRTMPIGVAIAVGGGDGDGDGGGDSTRLGMSYVALRPPRTRCQFEWR